LIYYECEEVIDVSNENVYERYIRYARLLLCSNNKLFLIKPSELFRNFDIEIYSSRIVLVEKFKEMDEYELRIMNFEF
jgi:hypothetical protein